MTLCARPSTRVDLCGISGDGVAAHLFYVALRRGGFGRKSPRKDFPSNAFPPQGIRANFAGGIVALRS